MALTFAQWVESERRRHAGQSELTLPPAGPPDPLLRVATIGDVMELLAGFDPGAIPTSGPATLVWYGDPDDSDSTPSAHPEWAGQLREATSPSGVVDQMTYEEGVAVSLRLHTFRENGVTRTMTYEDGTDNAVGVS
jgi:hypothetical protein